MVTDLDQGVPWNRGQTSFKCDTLAEVKSLAEVKRRREVRAVPTSITR